jgi:hypothetical protein
LVGITPLSVGDGKGRGVGDVAAGLAARVAGEGDALRWERFASALGKLARQNKQKITVAGRKGFFQKEWCLPGKVGRKGLDMGNFPYVRRGRAAPRVAVFRTAVQAKGAIGKLERRFSRSMLGAASSI